MTEKTFLDEETEKHAECQRILILPDIHIPFHDQRAIDLVEKVAVAFSPHILVQLGDLLNLDQFSKHLSRPAELDSVARDLESGYELLRRMDCWCSGRKIFIEGNHEVRARDWAWEKCAILTGTDCDPVNLVRRGLQIDKLGWEYVPYHRAIRIGKIYFTHDLGFSGKYATAQTLDCANHSIVIGHTHRLSCHTIGDPLRPGSVKGCYSFGWLGDTKRLLRANPYFHELRAARDWALGFGLGYLHTSGIVYFMQIPVINYGCIVEGSVFRA